MNLSSSYQNNLHLADSQPTQAESPLTEMTLSQLETGTHSESTTPQISQYNTLPDCRQLSQHNVNIAQNAQPQEETQARNSTTAPASRTSLHGQQQRFIESFKKAAMVGVVGFSVVEFWRGIWVLSDQLITPEDPIKSGAISLGLGAGILLAVGAFESVLAPPRASLDNAQNQNLDVELGNNH